MSETTKKKKKKKLLRAMTSMVYNCAREQQRKAIPNVLKGYRIHFISQKISKRKKKYVDEQMLEIAWQKFNWYCCEWKRARQTYVYVLSIQIPVIFASLLFYAFQWITHLCINEIEMRTNYNWMKETNRTWQRDQSRETMCAAHYIRFK